MSDQLTLPAEARDRAGKGASRELRREGRVPAVVYGEKKEPLSIHVEEKLLSKMLSTGHFMNSVVISFGSTLIGLIIAIPAAWAMAFAPTKRTKDVLMWMLSTKMMPPVGALIPIYLMFRNSGLLDTRTGLVMVLTLINLPIIVWMLYTYFKEIPGEILEAARMDGASLMKEIVYVLTPMAVPGIASTLLLNIILAWNEAFWTLNLTASKAAPLTAFIASYSSPEGLFYAKLSAASTMAIAPILILGWFSQKQLVRGLTFGAVK